MGRPFECGDGDPEAALARVPDGPAPGAQHAQPVDKPVDKPPEGMVAATFGRTSEPVRRGRDRFEFAEREAKQCVIDAIAAGHELRSEKVRQEWLPLDEAEIERRSRVDRTAPEYVNEDPATLDTYEHSQRLLWAAHWVLRSEVDTWAPPTTSGRVVLSEAAHEVLRSMGLQTLTEQQTDQRVCGGALLRHAFTPVEAQWLREGTIERARCQRCLRELSRDELLAQAEREAVHGTCSLCGEVLDAIANRCPHGHG